MQAAMKENWESSDPSTDTRSENVHLCSTCRHASRCMYFAVAHRPTFFCEEFSVQEEPTASDIGRVYPHLTESVERPAPKGLCVNCESKSSCLFMAPGGVWHCEEYQ